MAVAFVQHVAETSGDTSDTSLTLTVTTAVTAGHTIIVTAFGSLTDTVTVADTAGNSYTEDANASNGTTAGVRIFSVHNCTGLDVGDTITVAWSTAHAFLHATADEFSGLASSAADSTSSGAGNSATFTAGTLPLASTGELVFAAFDNVSNSAAYTYPAGAGFTRITTLHAQAGETGRDATSEYQIGPSGSSTPTLTPSGNHLYAGAAVAYFPTTVTATAQLEVAVAAASSQTAAVTGAALLTILAATNSQPAVAAAAAEVTAAASPVLTLPITGMAHADIAAVAAPLLQHIPVETDLTFQISTDDLIFDAAVQTTDGVTSISGVGGDSRTLKDDTAPSTDLTENSPLGSWNAGRAKARYLYDTRSKPRRDAPTVTLNATPLVKQWTVGSGQSPSAYQAAIQLAISDLVSLTETPNGGGDPIVALYFVEGIRIQIAADGSQWIATLNLSRADVSHGQDYFTFGLSSFGDGSVLTW